VKVVVASAIDENGEGKFPRKCEEEYIDAPMVGKQRQPTSKCAGNPVAGHNLDLALGNIINNPQFGRIHFKPQPKQDRRIGPGGKINHALVNKPDRSQRIIDR
jgi:hypothetical protein